MTVSADVVSAGAGLIPAGENGGAEEDRPAAGGGRELRNANRWITARKVAWSHVGASTRSAPAR
jgi:hypothetical protein